MILKKVQNENQQILYQPIDLKEAIMQRKEDLLFTSEDDEELFDNYLEKFEEEQKSKKEKPKGPIVITKTNHQTGEKEVTIITDEQIRQKASDISKDIIQSINGAVKGITQGTKDFFSSFSKHNLISALPFMDEKDIHELVEKIIENPDQFNSLPFAAILPFVEPCDADSLFAAALNDPRLSERLSLKTIAPFVTGGCLDQFAEEYMQGKYSDIEISTLYPFMESSTVKKLFAYFMDKNK